MPVVAVAVLAYRYLACREAAAKEEAACLAASSVEVANPSHPCRKPARLPQAPKIQAQGRGHRLAKRLHTVTDQEVEGARRDHHPVVVCLFAFWKLYRRRLEPRYFGRCPRLGSRRRYLYNMPYVFSCPSMPIPRHCSDPHIFRSRNPSTVRLASLDTHNLDFCKAACHRQLTASRKKRETACCWWLQGGQAY